MNNDFLASLDKLIGDETARQAEQRAEKDRLDEEGRQEADRIAALQTPIVTKLGEVSAIWNACLEAVQARSQALGFISDISGWQDEVTEWHNLQVNFHRHSGESASPLQLIVTERAVGQFKPVRIAETGFDFLTADPSVFTDRLLDHVTGLFHQIRDGR